MPDKPAVTPGPPALVIKNLHVMGDRDIIEVDGLDLEVRTGEIVGIAGVSGNGQRELAEAIAGLREVTAGSIHIGDRRSPTSNHYRCGPPGSRMFPKAG